MSKTERRGFLKACARTGLAVAAASWLAPRPVRAARPDKRVKVGQIGVGHAHAGGKMATLRKLADEFEVVGVAEPSEALREQWRDHPVYRGVPCMSIDQLLGTKGLQAVAVETEVGDLLPTAARCIAAGMHIHLDKPAGESLPRFREVLDELHFRRSQGKCDQGFEESSKISVVLVFRQSGEEFFVQHFAGNAPTAVGVRRTAGWVVPTTLSAVGQFGLAEVPTA